MDPFAGARRLENGALFYEVQDSELSRDLNNDEKLRAEFERLKQGNETELEVDEADIDELRVALLKELEKNSPNTLDELNYLLDQELSVFKEGEKYDFIKDIRNAYEDGLAVPEA